MKRDSFVFYRSFFEAIEKLKKNDKLTIYSHICRYALDGDAEELEGAPGALFDLIKPQIDANFRRFENGKKGAEYGKLGGRPKTPKKPQGNPKQTPNVNVNVNENVNENVNVCVDEKPQQTPTPTTTHIPLPTEVQEESVKLGYELTEEEVRRFLNYNEARGWKMEWKYALKRWLDKDTGKKQADRWGNDPDQRKEYGGEIKWQC